MGRTWWKTITPSLWFKKSRSLKCENSQDYIQKPQWNCTFLNSASGKENFTTTCLIAMTMCPRPIPPPPSLEVPLHHVSLVWYVPCERYVPDRCVSTPRPLTEASSFAGLQAWLRATKMQLMQASSALGVTLSFGASYAVPSLSAPFPLSRRAYVRRTLCRKS